MHISMCYGMGKNIVGWSSWMELDKQRFYGQFPKMCSNAVLKNQIIGSDIKSWFKLFWFSVLIYNHSSQKSENWSNNLLQNCVLLAGCFVKTSGVFDTFWKKWNWSFLDLEIFFKKVEWAALWFPTIFINLNQKVLEKSDNYSTLEKTYVHSKKHVCLWWKISTMFLSMVMTFELQTISICWPSVPRQGYCV
jgi:hypothetical protein